ncbi:hypothetical protein O1611_g10409 [Lasiodiplodia mahajangana]|uniref:Uncharacterized protein n=1 Tax=Lasiodiplodia mahajangana TaxID=1108764 RepID=A0ACC2IYW8_9PEZI|nr:hypothetical protein O1611_g10409 [Lasiodiplodia mahajangana]
MKEKARAAAPEEMWTGVPPAKSRPPSLNDQPLAFHVQIRARSTAAPIARAGLQGLCQFSPADKARAKNKDNKEGSYSRNGGEHALEEAKEKVGNLGATDRGLGEGLHETEVGEIADVGAAGVREGQTVTPEEPLEVNHGDRQHREHNE